MACGTPVIVGAVLDAPEFVADAGVLVNPDDINDLAQSIVKVLTESELRINCPQKRLNGQSHFPGRKWQKIPWKFITELFLRMQSEHLSLRIVDNLFLRTRSH